MTEFLSLFLWTAAVWSCDFWELDQDMMLELYNPKEADMFYAQAIDTTTGTLREEIGPFETREEAEAAEEELREKWILATRFRVRESG